MATDKFPNVFVAVLKQSLSLGGSEEEFYLSSVRTLDGQVMQASDFAYLGRGILSIDVQSASRIEFASFTGVDSDDNALTGGIRGLSFNSNTVIPANKKFHSVGAPVLIAFGTHNLIDLETIIQNNFASIEAQIAGLTGVYLEINGSNTPTANIDWGTHKIINLGNGTVAQDAVTFSQLQAAVVAGGVPATTSQGGYVKVATLAEFLAGTDTTVVGPFTFFNMPTVSQVNSVGSGSFKYGENITALDYVFQANGLETKATSNGNLSTTALPVITANTTFQGGLITPYATAVTIKSVTMSFGRYGGGTLTGLTTVQIFAVSGGLPTGGALATSGGQSIGGSNTQLNATFTFATPFTVTPGTTYALVANISGMTFSGGVQLEIGSSAGTGAFQSTNSGSTYSAQAFTLSFVLNQTLTAGDVYKVDPSTISNIGNYNYKGFALTTASSGTTNSIQLSNILGGFSSLLVGQNVYLNPSVSGGITQTAGSVGTNRIIGIATSATQIQLFQIYALI